MITRDYIDRGVYNQKFRFAKTVLESTEPDPVEYRKLLNDTTTFSYLLFKDNYGKRLKLYPYQDMILNSHYRFIYFRAANQIGKSKTFQVKGARNLVIDHGYGHNEAIVSKSLPQALNQMREVKKLLNSARFTWKEHTGMSDSMSVITIDIKDDKGRYKYTNMLICAPCTEGLLGYDLHDLNLDEFEFWDIDLKYFFNQIAQPRTYTTKGNILIMSNPNGQDNFGHDLEQQKLLNGKNKWDVYVFNYLDKPGNTQEEYDQLKAELSRHEFESTVAAIRSISDRNYFSPDEIDRSYDKNLTPTSLIGKQPIGFLDIGAKHDQSCFIMGYAEPDKDNPAFVHIYAPIIHLYPVGYPLTRVAGVDIDDSDGWHYEKSVKEHLKDWSIDGIVPTFGYDVTGNEGMKALFESIQVFGEDVTFSGPSKSGYYQRYKYYMEKGLFHRIKHDEWRKQASNLIVSKSARGYLLINAHSHTVKGGKSLDAKLKKTPDDTQDASAGFIYLADTPNNVMPSVTMLNFKKNENKSLW
jgi:hypothetical protein